MTPAFGQIQSPITVTTDKQSYVGGEVVMVTGEVRDLFTTTEVTMTVIAPNGNYATIKQITVNPDKTFSTEISIGGLISTEGTYTINVLYGADSRAASTSFELTDAMIDDLEVMITVEPSSGMFEVTDNEEYAVGFDLTTGDILSVTPNLDDISLDIAIATIEDGSLTVTIPRTVADATYEDGTDDQYFVLVDGQEENFEETVTDTERILTIDFTAGTEEIKIIGTWVIPEFGTIAVMILAVAIVSIIAVSARSKLSIIPRY
jgi:predicted secreted protein with PEFG-CTERM motif